MCDGLQEPWTAALSVVQREPPLQCQPRPMPAHGKCACSRVWLRLPCAAAVVAVRLQAGGCGRARAHEPPIGIRRVVARRHLTSLRGRGRADRSMCAALLRVGVFRRPPSDSGQLWYGPGRGYQRRHDCMIMRKCPSMSISRGCRPRSSSASMHMHVAHHLENGARCSTHMACILRCMRAVGADGAGARHRHSAVQRISDGLIRFSLSLCPLSEYEYVKLLLRLCESPNSSQVIRRPFQNRQEGQQNKVRLSDS